MSANVFLAPYIFFQPFIGMKKVQTVYVRSILDGLI